VGLGRESAFWADRLGRDGGKRFHGESPRILPIYIIEFEAKVDKSPFYPIMIPDYRIVGSGQSPGSRCRFSPITGPFRRDLSEGRCKAYRSSDLAFRCKLGHRLGCRCKAVACLGACGALRASLPPRNPALAEDRVWTNGPQLLGFRSHGPDDGGWRVTVDATRLQRLKVGVA